MFENDLKEPAHLVEAQALKRRISKNHYKMPEIEEKIRNYASGYEGEKTLSYYLGLLPEKKYHIYRGLRLPAGNNTYFQIDALLISPKLNLIIDAKNHSGTNTIEKHQMTQEYLDSIKNYENPIAQVNRHKILFRSLLDQFHIPEFPIENLVAFTKTSSKLVIENGYYEGEKKVIKAFDILKAIEKLEKQYKKEVINQKNIREVIKLLKIQHTPLKSNLRETMGISTSEIRNGVHCPKCFHIPMEFKHQLWDCPLCKFGSKDAFIPSICDYFLLNKPSFTNPEIREFLQIPSSRQTTYCLSLTNLPYIGTKRGRYYLQTRFPITSNNVSPKKTNTKTNENRGNVDEKDIVHT